MGAIGGSIVGGAIGAAYGLPVLFGVAAAGFVVGALLSGWRSATRGLGRPPGLTLDPRSLRRAGGPARRAPAPSAPPTTRTGWRARSGGRRGPAPGGRVERAPVDRDGDAGIEVARHLGRRPRRQVAGPEMRAPRPDRQQGDVDAIGEGTHRPVRRGVARRSRFRRSRPRSGSRRAGAGRSRPAPVAGGNGGDPRARGDLRALADADLADPQPDPAHRRAEASRDDDERVTGERPERRRVEMVGVGVRDRDDVDRAERVRVGRRAVTAERPEPVAQERIGQDPDVRQLEQDRRVAEIADTDGIRGRGRDRGCTPRPSTSPRSGAGLIAPRRPPARRPSRDRRRSRSARRPPASRRSPGASRAAARPGRVASGAR